MRVGTFVKGAFTELSGAEYLTAGVASVPGVVYEVRAETAPMSEEEQADVLGKLTTLRVPGMRVLGVDVGAREVRLQVQSQGFFWGALIALLPALIGPLVALVIGVIIAFRIPEWAYAIPFIGFGGGILLYAYMKGKGRKIGK